MKKIITISRQYASGGRTIGKQVAEKLGVKLYDSEIIKDTMRKTGLSEQLIASAEQRATNSFLFNLVMGVDEAHNRIKQIEKAEHELIQSYVDEGPCVIVGRTANFILNRKDTFNIFIYSDMEKRIKYAIEHYGIDKSQAQRMIEKSDRERRMYAANFYGKEWGNKDNYEMMLNSGLVGIDRCVKLICEAVRDTVEDSEEDTVE